jgi:hypothetical protein
MLKNKKKPCVGKMGRKIDVRVGPVKRGTCIYSTFNPRNIINKYSEMQDKAMSLCKDFTKVHKESDGIHSSCGYKAVYLEQLVSKEINWLPSKDTTYRSANMDGEHYQNES